MLAVNLGVFVATLLILVYHIIPRIGNDVIHHFRGLEEDDKPPVVKGKGKSVYLIFDGKKHHIPDWNTFVSLGYDISDIKGMSDQDINNIPDGEPLKAIVEQPHPINPYEECPCLSKSRFDPYKSGDIFEKRHHLCFESNNITQSIFNDNSEDFDMNWSFVEPGNYTAHHCDVIFRVISPSSEDDYHDKFYCPESCSPVPITEVVSSWITDPPSLDKDVTLTCSLRMSTILNNNSAIYHHYIRNSSGSDEHAHHRKYAGMLLREIARRRLEECREQEFWSSGLSHLDKDTLLHKFHNVPRQSVFGLIIWIGSESRKSLSLQQVSVLKERFSKHRSKSEESIVGWIATEDVYPCRTGTTLCETATSTWSYYRYMPTTRMAISPSGWSCAQRRPLRALSHAMLLFDASFILLVDDDTFVSIDMLDAESQLTKFIMKDMTESPIVLGQLTLGRKITKRGFYYGGAGYLMGKKVLDRLQSHEIIGPPFYSDIFRDPTQVHELSLLHQVSKLSNTSCPPSMTCIDILNHDKALQDVGSIARSPVRLIDICTNVMSDEHTCYHSDHAMSRCLLHGAYASPFNILCGGVDLGSDLRIGMCMGVDLCNTRVHLTCHRWMPDPFDFRNPVTASWNETSSFQLELQN